MLHVPEAENVFGKGSSEFGKRRGSDTKIGTLMKLDERYKVLGRLLLLGYVNVHRSMTGRRAAATATAAAAVGRATGRPVLPPGGGAASDPAGVSAAGGRARQSGVWPNRRRS